MDQFSAWIQQLKDKGYSDEEIGKMFAGTTKLSAADLEAAVLETLTEEEMDMIDQLPSEEAAAGKIQELFQQHTGMTLNQLMEKTQADVMKVLADNIEAKSTPTA